MWKQLEKQLCGTQQPIFPRMKQALQEVSENVPRHARSNSLQERTSELRTSEWYKDLSNNNKMLLKKTIRDLGCNGASLKMIVKLVSQRFNIGEKLAREVVIWRIKGDAVLHPIVGESELMEDVKMPSSDENEMIVNVKKIEHYTSEELDMKIALWESKYEAINHCYKDEVFQHLLDEEKKQATP